MRIDKVSIVIENIDEHNASVRIITDPSPEAHEEIEDTPCVLLGSTVWAMIEDYMAEDGQEQKAVTLQ